MKLGKTGVITTPNDVPISLRCYPDTYKPAKRAVYNDNANNGMIMTLNVETTKDQSQNLMFGSAGIWINEQLYRICLFYEDNLDDRKIQKIKEHGEKLQKQNDCTVTVLPKSEFIIKMFYSYVYEARAKLVGFDLPYQISRLATSWGTARKVHDAFSMKLVESNPRLPAIRIKSTDSNAAMIQFVTPLRKKSEKKSIPTSKVYRGYFIDLKTLAHVVTNQSFDGMDDVAKTFGIETKCYHNAIQNNIENTLTLHKIYRKIDDVLQNMFLVKPNQIHKLYSPASIGKLYLEKLNIKSFLEKNPEFPKEVLGYLMAAYYGGRVETRIRKTPVKVTCLDFTAMYPTMFCLQDMYRFLTAEKINAIDSTQETQKLLDRITIQDIAKPETWKKMVVLCKVKPDGKMILPVRSTYEKSKKAQNIGVNYLQSTDDTCLWYPLADLIASKFLTGRTPVIEEAISFVPMAIDHNLSDEKIEILNGVTVNPSQDNFIQKLVEKRLELRQSSDNLDKIIQNTIKIIANTASYGDYIQVNTESAKYDDGFVTVYGSDKPFAVDAKTLTRKETPSRHFNPIIGTFLTAGARLVLAIAESIVLQNKGYVAYMDTDSIFVSPEHANLVQEFFQKLNPYDKDILMFKIDTEDGKPLENVTFYGIASKKYVLFDYSKDKFTIHKCTLHGLGHLLDVDEKQWWNDILEMHYFPERKQEILDKYENKYAISKLNITTPNVLERFSKLKPFNKILIGTGYKNNANGNVVIPTTSYLDEKKRQYVQHMEFADYSTGKNYPNDESLDTSIFWKPLSLVLDDYNTHKESKSGGDVGLLPRLRLKINKNLVKFVGKETANLDVSNVVGIIGDNHTTYDNLVDKILDIRPRNSYKFGISRSNLIALQKKIRDGNRSDEPLRLQNKTIEKLKQVFSGGFPENYWKSHRKNTEIMVKRR